MKKEKIIFILALLSLVFFCLDKIISAASGAVKDRDMVEAAEIMDRAIKVLRGCAIENKIVIDGRFDINRTGLIGRENSPITTSLGSIEAKRTTANPNFAGLIAKLLKEAGIKRGDAVAVGASSSFPALVVAMLSAAKALDVKPVMICSLGASNWGANDPEFTWLEMLACLRLGGVFNVQPIALALGGEIDSGRGMSEEGRTLLADKIIKSGIYFLREPSLAANVQERMKLYEERAAPAELKAFVNIGGSWANMGTDSEVLKLRPGLNKSIFLPPVEKRGVVQEMAARGIPVIHLLYIKGFADQFGLPWDPVPLPRPGEGRLFITPAKSLRPAALLAGAYIILMLAALAFYPRKL
jgi:poly-gamma-glutamate system protein